MHPRQILRDAFAARLAAPIPDSDPAAYRTACRDRVYPSRVKPLFAKDMPAILVYTRAEKIDKASLGADGYGPLIRHLTLAVEIVAEGRGEGLDAALDEIAVEVEQALEGFEAPHRPLPNWDWMVVDSQLSEVDADFSASGETMMGGVRLTYAVTYETAPRLAEGGKIPTRLFAGFVPKIGTPHESDYLEAKEDPKLCLANARPAPAI